MEAKQPRYFWPARRLAALRCVICPGCIAIWHLQLDAYAGIRPRALDLTVLPCPGIARPGLDGIVRCAGPSQVATYGGGGRGSFFRHLSVSNHQPESHDSLLCLCEQSSPAHTTTHHLALPTLPCFSTLTILTTGNRRGRTFGESMECFTRQDMAMFSSSPLVE